MEETVLFPSPNWFQVSVLAVSKDGWVVYGGPSKSFCVLEPIPENCETFIKGKQRFHAHIVHKAYSEKIVSVDLSPLWPEHRHVLVGSADGSVKIWNLEKLEKTLEMKSILSHDIHVQEKEEVISVGYSTESFSISVGSSGVVTKWDLQSNLVKTNMQLLKHFKPLCMACSPHMQLHVAIGTKQGVVFVLDLQGTGKIIYKVRSQDDEVLNIGWCPQFEISIKTSLITNKDIGEKKKKVEELKGDKRGSDINGSPLGDTLPTANFTEDDSKEDTQKKGDLRLSIIHNESNEAQKIETKLEGEDANKYVEECGQLQSKLFSENLIETLLEDVSKIHINDDKVQEESSNSFIESATVNNDCRIDKYKHLLATIGKCGSVCIWDKGGKLVGSCSVPYASGKISKIKYPTWATLLWHKNDIILIGDGKSQLLQCNPLIVDHNNKLEWKHVHSLHKRGLFLIASNAPRVQKDDEAYNRMYEESVVWSVSQDRQMICYSLKDNKILASYATIGGFVYSVQACLTSGKRVAISVGDGAVRVWEPEVPIDDDIRGVNAGSMSTYWQNVQGKVLTGAWCRVKDNQLAFGTAESRVGVIDVNKSEKPAKVLHPALSGAVYSISWGEGYDLYACGGGKLVIYRTDKPYEVPEVLNVEVEGRKQAVSAVYWSSMGLLCGSNSGAFAVYTSSRPHQFVTASILFNKMIYSMEWHPQTVFKNEVPESHKNLIAVCSLDKQNIIMVLDYKNDEEGKKKLHIKNVLRGHRSSVLQVSWSPHQKGLLLSTSTDATVRVWDGFEGTCISIFPLHVQTAYCASWCAWPQFSTKVISGGADCCVRLWDIQDFPASDYDSSRHDFVIKKEKKKKEKKEEPLSHDTNKLGVSQNERTAACSETTVKGSKKFLLPITYKQMNPCKIKGARILLKKYMEQNSITVPEEMENYCKITETEGYDYLKLFGTLDELNSLCDMEMERQLQNNTEAWVVMSVFRGYIANMIKVAAEKDILDPFVINIAPSLSTKLWRDAMHMYITQIDRLRARKPQQELDEARHYGGPIYRKTVAHLIIGNLMDAIAVLQEARLYKEAFVLCKLRLTPESPKLLKVWADECFNTGTLVTAATCYIGLGDLYAAATALAKAKDEELLSLAADCAAIAGHKALVEHIADQKALILPEKKEIENDTPELVDELPSRIEVILEKSKETETTSNISENIQN